MTAIRGWSILTDNAAEIAKVINKAPEYDINHLQLSHDLIMDLRQVKDPEKQRQINDLIDRAHRSGIAEVTVWDHALYPLDYYPDRFKNSPGGTLNFDDDNFWAWFRQDYRDMMALIPEVDGIVLTFIETGARAERQYSEVLRTDAEKLASVINNVADIIIGELGKKLYIRTFAYDEAEYRVTVGCIEHLRRDDIVLMMKETPHDFFLTHPNDRYAGTIDRPTIIEFDAGNEFNGQGVIANTWPEYVLARWQDLRSRPNVVGYVARTDRYGTTSIVDRPSEVLLYALKRYSEDTTVTAEVINDEFISSRYGTAAIPYVKPAFERAFAIVTSSLYTLGTNVANHSRLDFDAYPSSYARHVSGKWITPPEVYVGHGVNKKFHYWKDVVQHIAPPQFKLEGGQLTREAAYVLENGWVTPDEQMNEAFLGYILAEKAFGVNNAAAALASIREAKALIDSAKYEDLYHTFYRTWITARLYEAVARAYYGYRIYARGERYRTESLMQTIKKGLTDILLITEEMEAYVVPYPIGQWDWKDDGEMALSYYKKISEEGWAEYGGIVFKEAR